MKKPSRTSTIAAAFVALCAFTVLGMTLYRGLVQPPLEAGMNDSTTANVRDSVTTVSSDVPQRLIIPAIGINANVQRTGVSKKGTMAVPTNYTDVGWYRYGSVPGESGSAVMAGHLDNGFGLSAVFKHLADLNAGDDVYVKDASGEMLHFKVRKVELLDPTSSTQEIFASSNSSHLNLITCEGDWIPSKKMYSGRRVVFTDFVGTS
jgi:LPXTG-site transpeptidase (sortase) family protein